MTREERHYRYVASLPCAACGIVGFSQAAHSNRAKDGKGLGIKAHYLKTFPLCCTRPGVLGCHVRHDQCIGMTRAEADERTDRYLAQTEAALRARGLWPTQEEIEEEVRPASPIRKVARTPEERAAREALRNARRALRDALKAKQPNEKGRIPVRARSGPMPSVKTAKCNSIGDAIVSDQRKSTWPKGRKLTSANRFKSRPFPRSRNAR